MSLLIKYAKDTSISVRTVIFLFISIGISILSISCLVVLAKEKKLKEKRFSTLTIFVSISDAATGQMLVSLAYFISFVKELYIVAVVQKRRKSIRGNYTGDNKNCPKLNP
jgi:hypothetical protein